MRILVACETSGTVRDAFLARGHDAWSCDLDPHDSGSSHRHVQCNILSLLSGALITQEPPTGLYNVAEFVIPWDLMIAHPPCERLCVSGARWKYEKDGWADEQETSLSLVRALLDAPIPRIALENPVGIISTRIRKPDQVLQPWMFGHGETKATCLWLKNLPVLVPTHIDNSLFEPSTPKERETRVHSLGPSPMRKKLRSWRYKLIAEAMADQWGRA